MRLINYVILVKFARYTLYFKVLCYPYATLFYQNARPGQ